MTTRRASNQAVPHPFLKWVGGKRQLLPALLREAEAFGGFRRYHEPFVGGGALFFELFRLGKLGRTQARLSDTNPNLIAAYQGVRDEVDAVIAILREHEARHDRAYFYAMRSAAPATLAEKAARIIYLNRTCFNGLYRENSRGEFNVPMGRYTNPLICNERNLRAASEALKKAVVESRPFENVVAASKPGDLVYFDPPYVPLSTTANFTTYGKDGFGEADQRRLAEVFDTLAKRGVHVLLSNSAAPLVYELYKDQYRYRVIDVSATRNVNSKADKRGAVTEALVTSRGTSNA